MIKKLYLQEISLDFLHDKFIIVLVCENKGPSRKGRNLQRLALYAMGPAG
jgi:hypothetical protein